MSVSSREPGVVVVNPDCRRCGRKLANESDLLVGLCNNSEACERRRVAQEQLFAVDPLDSLRELRDDLAHDEDRSFVNTANEVIDRWSTERAQHAAALASRDARIAELESELELAWSDEHDPLKVENEKLREQYRGLRAAVGDALSRRRTALTLGDAAVRSVLKDLLDRCPAIESTEKGPEQ